MAKSDFLVMTNRAGLDVIVNIKKINFIVPDDESGEYCYFFFGAGEDDCLSIKTSIDAFLELI